MTLTAGTQFGHYEILSRIGAGGMGEVYLAKDTRLERTVAFKILPADVASNDERMRRFTQEAKAAAALNHPNIAHIYEIGEADGTHFIAMEYVEGVTLNEKIYREKTPLRKLLKYLTQVAEGLAKAHAAGIVHRDLKPDNIMIARDDYAKILDFGLAKLIEPQGGNQSDSASSEIATAILQQHSTPGMIMGTAGYMSPEQAQGKVREIDHRSDIFSFGCIVYEAVTCRKAFEGTDQLDSLHKIVHAPTPQIQEVNPEAPNELQRIIRRCLAKEPDKRYQSIKDIAIELDELQQELKDKGELDYSASPDSSSGGTSANRSEQIKADSTGHSEAKTNQEVLSRSTSSAEYIVSGMKRHKTGAILALALLIIALVGIGYGIYKWKAKENKPALSFQSAKFTRLTSSGKILGAAISPDGKYVAHIQDEGGQQSLWVRQVATQSNVQIIPPAEVGYSGLTFSPDGNYVYYSVYEADARGVLYQVPTLGGAPRKLLTGVRSAVAFSPDGRQIAFFRGAGVDDALMIANADGTGERQLAVRSGDEQFFRGAFSTLSWSPDGKTIATPLRNFPENYMTVAVVSVETGEVKSLTPQRWFEVKQVAWIADGSDILITALEQASAGFKIWRISYPSGEVQKITNDLNSYLSVSFTADNKALATVQSERTSNLWVMPPNDSARAAQITRDRNNRNRVAWMPDGRIIYNSDESGSLNLYLMDSDGGNAKQLTANSGWNGDASVSSDGRNIIFMSDRTGPPHIWRMDSDGGNQRQLTKEAFNVRPQLSPDGQWIVYASSLKQGWYIWKMPVDGGQPVQLTEKLSDFPAFSPDGKQIACYYWEDSNAPTKIAIFTTEGGPQPIKTFTPTLPAGRETNLSWTADGKAIVYGFTRGGVSNLWAQPVDGSAPKQLTNFTSERILWFEFSRDGKQLALARGTQTRDVVLIKDFR
jgi:eukaryotic-like serine/threonine-protein kinase